MNAENAAWRAAADTVAELNFDQYRNRLIHETPEIRGFLAETRAERFIISAPKGYGKTLLLIAKRMQLNEHSPELDRGGEIVDRPPGTFADVSKDRIREYRSDFDLWRRIWTYSIMVAAINVHSRLTSTKDGNEDGGAAWTTGIDSWTREVFRDRDRFRSPTLIFTALLAQDYTQRQKALASFNRVAVVFAGVQSQVAFFIDNVDEYFAPTLENHSTAATVGGADQDQQKSNEIWIIAQLGLVVSAFQIHRSNHHVRVYCTVRREAFLKLRDYPVELTQILGSTIEIQYGRRDLEIIFQKNVRLMNRDSLFSDAEQDSVAAFFGPQAKSVRHRLVEKSESAFDYVLRHTFYRPRDLMRICGRIAAPGPEERSPERIKEIVDEESIQLVYGILSEMRPFFDLPDIDVLLSCIRTNTPSRAGLEAACDEYLDKVKERFAVDPSDLKVNYRHPFCTLYQMGMLGWIQPDPREQFKDIQRFLKPRDVEVGKNPGLPITDNLYLIHPALDRMIADRAGKEYFQKYHRANIIGADLPWTEPAASLFVIKGDLCGFSRIMNTEFYESIATKLHDWTRAACAELDFVEVSGGDSILMIDRSADKVVESMSELLARAAAYREQNLTFRFGGSAGPITFKPLERRIASAWEETLIPLGQALRSGARIEPHAPRGRLVVDTAFVEAANHRLENFRFEEVQPDDVPNLMYDAETKIYAVQKSTTDPVYETRLYAVSAVTA